MTFRKRILTHDGASTAPIAILAGRVIDGTGRPAGADRRAVLIEGGRIALVASVDRVVAAARRARAAIVDALDGTLIPGLVDGHVHLAWDSRRSFEWRAEIEDEAELTAFALASAEQVLATGVTTVRDCGAPRGVTIAARDRARERRAPAPRMVVCGPAVTTVGGHGEYLGMVAADSPDELRAAVRYLVALGVDFIKVMATGGFLDAHTDRRQAQYSVDALRALAVDAHAQGRRVVAHANATEGIRNAVRAGIDTIAHCNWLGREEGTLDYDSLIVQQMAIAGTSVDLNLEGAMAPLVGRDVVGPAPPDAPHDRWELFAEMRELGVGIFLTSDRPGPSAADFPRLLAAAGRQWRLSADELVWRATGLPAKVIGVADSVGTIEEGKVADLVLLEGDLREDVAALGRVVSVYMAGRSVGASGIS